MRLNKENIGSITEDPIEIAKLLASVDDMTDINERSGKDFYIDWQDFHDEWSPEWTDPCPDYYGFYTIRESSQPYEVIGPECATEWELENVILTISDIYNL